MLLRLHFTGGACQVMIQATVLVTTWAATPDLHGRALMLLQLLIKLAAFACVYARPAAYWRHR